MKPILNKEKKQQLLNDLRKKLSVLSSSHVGVDNPETFIQQFLKIAAPYGNLTNFTLTYDQQRFLHQMQNKTVIFEDNVKRAIGTTTLLCAYSLWKAITHPGSIIINATPLYIMGRYNFNITTDLFYNSLLNKNQLKGIDKSNMKMEFMNGSLIITKGENALLGNRASLVIAHNISKFTNIKSVITNIAQTVTPYDPVRLY